MKKLVKVLFLGVVASSLTGCIGPRYGWVNSRHYAPSRYCAPTPTCEEYGYGWRWHPSKGYVWHVRGRG